MNLSDESILIVDDVSENIQVALNVLKPIGISFSFAMSGKEALNVIKNKRPSLILLDIIMPEMDGYEVCRILKNDILYNDIPIIFLTAKSNVNDLVKGFEYGGIDFIAKPFQKKELFIRVKTHLQNYLSQNKIKYHLNNLIQEQQKLQLFALQQSKIASIGEMMLSISHQWKQPLSAISLGAINVKVKELLKENPDKLLLNNLNMIEEQIKFMVDTMHDFSNFFKPDKDKSHFSLMQSSYELINLFSSHFTNKSVTIDLEFENGHDFKIFGYENLYKQALINIILNAVDEIEKKCSANKNILIKCYKDDKYGVISITNYAGQIPKLDIDKIFDKFFTTKGENGTGIGLSMAKQIIEELGEGKLLVKNIDCGVTFTIKLPIK